MRWLGWDHSIYRHETLKIMIMIYKRRKRNLAEITLVRVEIVEVNLIFRISASLSRCRGWWKFCGWARRRRRLWTHYSSKDYFHSYLPAGLLGSITNWEIRKDSKEHQTTSFASPNYNFSFWRFSLTLFQIPRERHSKKLTDFLRPAYASAKNRNSAKMMR